MGLFGSGLALALLWWNRAVWVLRNWGLAAVEGWLLMVALPSERAEQRRDSLPLKAVEHLDRASITMVVKVSPSDYKHPQDFTERKKHKSFLWKFNHVRRATDRFKDNTVHLYCKPYFIKLILTIMPGFIYAYNRNVLPTLQSLPYQCESTIKARGIKCWVLILVISLTFDDSSPFANKLPILTP